MKEIEFISTLYTDMEDKQKAAKKVFELRESFNKWLDNFEYRGEIEEVELDDKLNRDEDRMTSLYYQEEEKTLRPLNDENLRLLNEKKELIDNFDDIKFKLINRV